MAWRLVTRQLVGRDACRFGALREDRHCYAYKALSNRAFRWSFFSLSPSLCHALLLSRNLLIPLVDTQP
jgi:hypothetical protein